MFRRLRSDSGLRLYQPNAILGRESLYLFSKEKVWQCTLRWQRGHKVLPHLDRCHPVRFSAQEISDLWFENLGRVVGSTSCEVVPLSPDVIVESSPFASPHLLGEPGAGSELAHLQPLALDEDSPSAALCAVPPPETAYPGLLESVDKACGSVLELPPPPTPLGPFLTVCVYWDLTTDLATLQGGVQAHGRSHW